MRRLFLSLSCKCLQLPPRYGFGIKGLTMWDWILWMGGGRGNFRGGLGGGRDGGIFILLDWRK